MEALSQDVRPEGQWGAGRRDGGGEATGGFGSSPGERVRAHQHVPDGKESVTMKTLAKSRHHIKSQAGNVKP